jgi:hypothetical protein
MINEPLTLIFTPDETELMRRVLSFVVSELEYMTDDDAEGKLAQLASSYAQVQIVGLLLRKFLHSSEIERMDANVRKRREDAIEEARKAAGVADAPGP